MNELLIKSLQGFLTFYCSVLVSMKITYLYEGVFLKFLVYKKLVCHGNISAKLKERKDVRKQEGKCWAQKPRPKFDLKPNPTYPPFVSMFHFEMLKVPNKYSPTNLALLDLTLDPTQPRILTIVSWYTTT